MNCKQIIVVRKDLGMRKGKIAAQVAHASMMFLFSDNGYRTTSSFGAPNQQGYFVGNLNRRLNAEEYAWLTDPESAFAKVVVSVDSEQELRFLVQSALREGIIVHEVIDAGRTEFNGVPTRTCAAFGPHECKKLDNLTGHLKLL